MGIDTHALHLLRYSRERSGALGRTATLGRMVVHLGPRARERLTGASAHVSTVYGEQMLIEHFGASVVDAIDNSAYEGAPIIADLNKPLPELSPYNTVIDFGCLEHVFDVRQAFRNVADLCNIGGRILHILPANGYCGHGFYQYSPELFFSLYQEHNGFANTEVYVAHLRDTSRWYKVSPPSSGMRVNLRSSSETVLLVTTHRVADVDEFDVQQSDYEFEWQKKKSEGHRSRFDRRRARLRELLIENPLTSWFAHEIDAALSASAPKRINARHPALTEIRTSSF